MNLLNEKELVVKKSKFIALYYEVNTTEEVKDILNSIKAKYKDARHYPYAYLLDNTAGKSDDGEPNNTAGLPLYNLLQYTKKTNRLIVVVRYFGGTKLGASNLLRSYVNAAKMAMENELNK